MSNEPLPEMPNIPTTILPPGDDGIVVIVDERVGTPDGIIGQPLPPPPVTYQVWQPGQPVPAGAILMTREVAEMSGYLPKP